MENKQIIINGIDVSRCEYRDWHNSCHCDNSKENEGEKRVTGRGGCKYNPNCHYKQLKRKEQECEELKKTIMYKCPQCGDEYLSPIGASLYEENYKLKQTLTEIKEIVEKILVRRQLEDIAQRLNKGHKINWNDDNQIKYCIRFNFPLNTISTYARLHQKLQGTVYCLDKNFKDVAIEEIGEERLKKYLRGK